MMRKVLRCVFFASLFWDFSRTQDRTVNITQCTSAQCTWESYECTMNCTQCGCSQIPIINATDSWFSWLPWIHDVKSMTKLILKSNPIGTVTPFLEYSYLKHLDLTNCRVISIDEGAFQKLKILEVLVLKDNRLSNISVDHFKGLQNLQQLDLSGNLLTIVSDNTFYMYLNNLERLDLSNNQIKSIAYNAFADLRNLQFLHLEHNSLYAVSSDYFLGLTKLKELWLHGNLIGSLPTSFFAACRSLEVLNLSSNTLQKFEPLAFKGLDKLLILDLSQNLISGLNSGAMTNLVKLQSVYLDHNPIQNVEPGSFPTSLQQVIIKWSDDLEIIRNDTFANLTDLRSVDISHNRHLKTIESGAFGAPGSTANLVSLNLQNNALSVLSEHLVNWSTVEEVVLAGNEWHCGCDLAWAQNTKYFNKETAQQIICHDPYHLHGRSLAEVHSLSCDFYDEHRGGIEVSVIVFVTVVFLGITITLAYKFRHTVFPCAFNTPGKYSAMYNSVNTDDTGTDEIEKVQIVSEKEHVLPGPTAV